MVLGNGRPSVGIKMISWVVRCPADHQLRCSEGLQKSLEENSRKSFVVDDGKQQLALS